RCSRAESQIFSAENCICTLSKSPFLKWFIHLAPNSGLAASFRRYSPWQRAMTLRKQTYIQLYRQKLHLTIETTCLFSTSYEKQNPHHHYMSGTNDKTPQTTSINVSVLCNWNESI